MGRQDEKNKWSGGGEEDGGSIYGEREWNGRRDKNDEERVCHIFYLIIFKLII